jgi:dTDP-4-amino-4,6-dideoxygalactose transaminase
VHWGGQPVDLDEINFIAKKYNLKVVEDAAHSVRSFYKNKRIGTHSDFVCFSFQAVKHLTTADGGAIACKSEKDANRIRKLRWFGLDRKFKGPSRWEQDIAESGFKYHMNNMNAIIGLLQLEYVDSLIDSHIKNSKFLFNNIKNSKIKNLLVEKDRDSSCWLHTILVEDRDLFREQMKSKGIQVDVAHVSNLRYSVFKEFNKEDLPNLKYFDENIINIPCGWWLSKEDLDYIVETINKY